MKSIFSELNSGFLFILRGWGIVLKNKDLLVLSLIPMLINLVLFFFSFSFGLDQINLLIQALMGFLNSGAWYFAVLSWLLTAIFYFTFFILLVYVIYLLGMIVSSPFLALMAERLFKKNNMPIAEQSGILNWLAFTVKMVAASILKAIVLLLVAMVLFICSLLPGVNIFTSLMTCVIIAFDTTDYAFELQGMSLKQRFEYLRQNFAQYVGMGTFVTLTVMIPGLTLVAMPAMVMGSTQLFIDKNKGKGNGNAGVSS